MSHFSRLFLGLVWIGSIYGQDIFQSIRVFDPSPETIQTLANAGIPLDHIQGKDGVFIDVVATEDQTTEIISNGLSVEILIQNLTAFYQERNIPESSREFQLGSMQGNYTWDELNDRFDELQETYSHLISERFILGQSIEGRDIWAFKLSDNPEEDEDEPEVLFTALTHSREPVGMMNLFYFVQLLCESYETDSELTFLANEREIWFLPVINPDGYVYNESIQPNGGGMHRKNRRDTNCGNGTDRGVDLNRNYGYGWGANNTGSSPDPCATTYRGEAAFSEPETQMVRDFIEDRNFNNVIHYHTYSNVYIHPYGNATLPDEPDLTTFREIGNEMARFNGYGVGTGYETIGYTVNGDAVDWTYGHQGLISFTPEVGSYSQGFWPSENDVIPLCEDQVHPNKIFSLVAGADIILHSYEMETGSINPGDEFDLDVAIQNRGLSHEMDDIEVLISSLTNDVSVDLDSYIISGLDARDLDNFSVDVSINENAQNGAEAGIVISTISETSYPRQDTILFLIGTPEILFYDGFENEAEDWELTGEWGLTTNAYSGANALTDSPDGDYEPASEITAEIEVDLDLTLVLNPQVTFQAKWDIESNWDFVRFQANVDGEDWISLEGENTEPGVGQPAQPLGEHGYDGQQYSWVEETVELNQLGPVNIVGFRFILTSDYYVEGDGFTFDDFTISGFHQGVQGDFNLDGAVNIFDILGLVDALIFDGDMSELQQSLCDLDGNGVIDINDLLTITDLIMGI